MLHTDLVLRDLWLPKEHFLHLHLAPGEISEQQIQANLRVRVIDETRDEKIYNLNFSASQTVAQVKREVASVTDIPVFRQSWTGWPEQTKDSLSLIKIGLEANATLRVRRDEPAPSVPVLLDDSIKADDSIEDEDEDVDYDESMEYDDFLSQSLTVSPSRFRLQPLLPDNFGDETLAGIKFGEEFGNRYGQAKPHFFLGSLEDAFIEALGEERMVAVYLHHDSSVFTHVFCTQVLCSPPVLSLLAEHVTVWGWDLTRESNRHRCLSMLARQLGSVASSTLRETLNYSGRNFEVDRLPLLILIGDLRGSMEIVKVKSNLLIKFALTTYNPEYPWESDAG